MRLEILWAYGYWQEDNIKGIEAIGKGNQVIEV